MTKQEPLPSDALQNACDDMPKKEFVLSLGDPDHIDAISEHVQKHLGPVKSVFHEIWSDKVHVDVHWVEPTESFPFNFLVTSGMSERPMCVPEELEGFDYAELYMILPPDWPLDEKSLENEDNSWPLHSLRQLARFPHEYDTYFHIGHTVGGDGDQRLSPNCPFAGFLIYVSSSLGENFLSLPREDGKSVVFYCLIPLYKEEIELKNNEGLDKLFELFAQHGVSVVVDPERQCVC